MSHRMLVAALGVAALLGAASSTLGSDGPRRTRHAKITSGLDCSACHTAESWHILEASGTGGGFDHSRTGFPLTGRHRDAACTECHRGGAQKISRVCASCHDDAHSGRLGQACDGCHSSTGWSRTSTFDRHRLTRLPLTGMHALADCTECHRQSAERGYKGVPADCFACHAADYRRTDIHPLHTGVSGDPSRPPLPRNCAECHRATGWSPALITDATFAVSSAASALTAQQLLAHESRFPIRSGKHRGVECRSCHVDPSAPKLARCDGCHEHGPVKLRRRHRGPVSPQAASCLTCHPGGAAR